jgi:hypothetical protein
VNHTLGWIHYKRGAAREAVPLLRAAADGQPKNPRYRLHLGLAYARAGDALNACESLSAALRLDPGVEGGVEGAAEGRTAGAQLAGCDIAPSSAAAPAATRTSRVPPR